MGKWTHRADGKPISKNFEDKANYMQVGQTTLEVKKEDFGLNSAHSAVEMKPKSFTEVSPKSDQRGGPVTRLQLEANPVKLPLIFGDGELQLKDSNGTKYKLYADTDGVLHVTEVTT